MKAIENESTFQNWNYISEMKAHFKTVHTPEVTAEVTTEVTIQPTCNYLVHSK